MAAANANPDNWKWHAESRKIWMLTATEDWHKEFNTKWYGSECALLHDSESPSFSAPCFRHVILVRECYDTMFVRVWEKAMTSGGAIGSLVIGQPGAGKTMLLVDILRRLLQLRQVVLFTLDGVDLYLFYHGKVYTTTEQVLYTTPEHYRLPQPKSKTSDVFIWSLFEITKKREPSGVLIAHPCLPVQAAPPDSIRFKIWRKQCRPMCVGLPLWTRDELAKGLPYQRQYDSLLDALRKDPSRYERDHPLQSFPGVRELLDEFQQDANFPVPPETALDYLLGIAIDHFGHSARDVFDAVFDYSKIMEIHQAALRLKFADLDDSIYALLTMQNPSDLCHDILSLSPVCSNPYSDDRWTVSFKSDWIARSITQHIGAAEGKAICRRIVQRFPQASAVAACFERDTQSRLLLGPSQNLPADLENDT